MRCATFLACLMLAATPAIAKDTARANLIAMNGTAAPACIGGMTKNASINISFNGREKTLTEARAAFDTQKKNMETEMGKLGAADQLKLNSYNYNLSMNPSYEYGQASTNITFNGNLSYEVKSEELAKKIADKLAEMKQQFSMNVNASSCAGMSN